MLTALNPAARPVQHAAAIALVECLAREEDEWRRRLEARGQQDANTERSHKPGSWADLAGVRARNAGSEGWSRGGVQVPLHLELDTTSRSLEDNLEAVVRALREQHLL